MAETGLTAGLVLYFGTSIISWYTAFLLAVIYHERKRDLVSANRYLLLVLCYMPQLWVVLAGLDARCMCFSEQLGTESN